jgi:hypothetical protein
MKHLLLVLVVVGASSIAHAQQIVGFQQLYKGIVVDSATFAPLAYVSVQVKGKGMGTTSDVKGNFSVAASPQDTIILSLLGYERLELPLFDYETGLIRMAERTTTLKSITITDTRLDNPYEGLFDDQNRELNKKLHKRIPFYYDKSRKDKIKAGRWRQETLHVQTYLNLVVNNPATKADLMKTYGLTEQQYYNILTKFNEKYYNVMYFLTTAELASLLNRFFEAEH